MNNILYTTPGVKAFAALQIGFPRLQFGTVPHHSLLLTTFFQSFLVDESSPAGKLSIIDTSESTAIRPRTLVFHIARKSLAFDSIISMEKDPS